LSLEESLFFFSKFKESACIQILLPKSIVEKVLSISIILNTSFSRVE